MDGSDISPEYTWQEVTGAPPPAAPHASSGLGGYILRHWLGENSLPFAFWVNKAGLGAAWGLLTLLIVHAAGTAPLPKYSAIMLLLTAAGIPVAIWSITGLWKTTTRLLRTPGHPRFWSYAVRTLVAVNCFYGAGIFVVHSVPQITELMKIAAGKDSIGTIKVRLLDGQTMLVEGGLGAGSARIMEQFYLRNPGIKTVVLNSHGGRLREAERAAGMVKKYALSTYVDGMCASGCTYIFLAGRERAATPNAKIGFHRPYAGGWTPMQDRAAEELMRQYYRRAGLSEKFVQKVIATPSADMWYPAHGELISEGVVTRTSSGGESRLLVTSIGSKDSLNEELRKIPLYAALEQRKPGVIAKVADNVWQAKNSGGSDAEAMAGARQIIAASEFAVLMTSTPELREEMLKLMLEQYRAAYRQSPALCRDYLIGRGIPSQVLPADLIGKEFALVEKAATGPVKPAKPVTLAQYQKAMAPVFKGLPPKYRKVIAAGFSGKGDPAVICNSVIELYARLLRQPKPVIDQAARYIFSEAEQ